jgi:hypothetical protein
MDPDISSERPATEGSQEYEDSFILTAAKMERHMKDRLDQLLMKLKTGATSEEDIANLIRLQEEWEMTRQLIDTYSKAERHLNKNISIIENHATGNAIQFMVSPNGKILHGSNRGVGPRTRQVGGYIDNKTTEEISKYMSSVDLQNIASEDPSSSNNTSSAPNDGVENEPTSEYMKLYGRGFKFMSENTENTPTTSMPSQEGRLNSSPK